MTKFTEPQMTNQQQPITPPPALINQWLGEFFGCTVNGITDSTSNPVEIDGFAVCK